MSTHGSEGRHAPVVIYAASSADGFLAPPDGSVGWLDAFGGEGDADFGYDAFFGGIGSIVVGRTTFEQVLGFGEWPYAGRPTAVLTSRPGGVDALPNDTVPDDSLPDGVRRDGGADLGGLLDQLQAEAPGRGTWLLGGGAVHQAFLAEGLVNEIWTHVMPVLLGDGIRMFPAAYPSQPLTLVESRTYHGNGPGVVLLRYRVG
jgi:dihydrofolate reductase